MSDNKNSVTFIGDALTSIINYAHDPDAQNAQDMTIEQRMAGMASHAYAARDELEMVKVEINALRATIRELRNEVAAANNRAGVVETDAERRARELAHKEFERLQTEGAQKFGMMWLRANIPMSRLASGRYLPVGTLGETQPHVKALLCAAAWVLCEHETHSAEIFERQHKRGLIQYEALTDIARTVVPTMSMALDTDHLTNLLTAKLRGVIERAQKAIADDNAPPETYTPGQYREARGIFHDTGEPAEVTIARVRDQSEAAYFAAISDGDEAADDPDCCDDDTPPRYYCAPESLPELRRFASFPDGEWHEAESSADADYLSIVGLIEWDGNWEPQRYRIGAYGRETLRRVDELPPVDPQRFKHQYVAILNDGRYAFDMRPAERQGYWTVTLESTRVIIEVPESYIVGESPF